MITKQVILDTSKCKKCGFCLYVNTCHSPRKCIGCLSCYWACPYNAKFIIEKEVEEKQIEVIINGVKTLVPSSVTVAKALEYSGFQFDKPGSRKPNLSCKTGGCWSCAVVIDGSLERACIMPIREGMNIETDVSKYKPLRIIHGPEPHVVGGKATPWWEVNYIDYVEAAIWTAGCNLRCPQCQNYSVTYDNTTPPLTPDQAAKLVITCHREYRTKGIAVSGGEPSINRNWIVEFFREVSRRLKPKTRKHLDSNGTILTPDYIDELVESGCNNIGVEPKCSRVETYMKITGITNRDIAYNYIETSWKAIEYIYEKYSDQVYLGIGLIYNSDLITLEEISEAGEKIYKINPEIQVTVLDYFPAFKRRSLKRPTLEEMLIVKKTLEDRGLKTVIVQTKHGHIGPGDRNKQLAY